jgi:hypothetical protein
VTRVNVEVPLGVGELESVKGALDVDPDVVEPAEVEEGVVDEQVGVARPLTLQSWSRSSHLWIGVGELEPVKGSLDVDLDVVELVEVEEGVRLRVQLLQGGAVGEPVSVVVLWDIRVDRREVCMQWGLGEGYVRTAGAQNHERKG